MECMKRSTGKEQEKLVSPITVSVFIKSSNHFSLKCFEKRFIAQNTHTHTRVLKRRSEETLQY